MLKYTRVALTFAVISLIDQSLTSEFVLADDSVISKVAFGSCIKQDRPVPILKAIANSAPDLFVFLGDNIYADTTDIALMRRRYALLADDKGFQQLAKTCPLLATWDDHDYGANDAGADYPKRAESQQAFLDFWQDKSDSPRRHRSGVYQAHIYGPVGKRLQVILLDTRYFRGPLTKGERRIGGPYIPSKDASVTMLGKAQWKWLEQQLRKPADVRLIASSIQCVGQASGQETWSNLPHERDRLFGLITKTKANGVVILSGDRHWSELSVETESSSYPIYDITSSSLNQIHGRGTPTENKYRVVPKTYHRPNFGMIEIDWNGIQTKLEIQIRDSENRLVIDKSLTLKSLRHDR